MTLEVHCLRKKNKKKKNTERANTDPHGACRSLVLHGLSFTLLAVRIVVLSWFWIIHYKGVCRGVQIF